MVLMDIVLSLVQLESMHCLYTNKYSALLRTEENEKGQSLELEKKHKKKLARLGITRMELLSFIHLEGRAV